MYFTNHKLFANPIFFNTRIQLSAIKKKEMKIYHVEIFRAALFVQTQKVRISRRERRKQEVCKQEEKIYHKPGAREFIIEMSRFTRTTSGSLGAIKHQGVARVNAL